MDVHGGILLNAMPFLLSKFEWGYDFCFVEDIASFSDMYLPSLMNMKFRWRRERPDLFDKYGSRSNMIFWFNVTYFRPIRPTPLFPSIYTFLPLS